MSFWKDVAVLFGSAVGKPEQVTPEAKAIHQGKRGTGPQIRQMLREMEESDEPKSHTWRNRRWAVLIFINLLFTLSFWFDVQLVEGSLTASRFLGFHMADVYSGLLIMLADKHVPVNLVIGMVTVWILWAILGGRTFCSWVCPYHLLSEWTDSLHAWLAKKKLVKDHAFHRGTRVVLWFIFALMALVSGQTLFLTLNPVGILSRAVVYGPSLALGWVVVLLLFEVVYSRRFWCRYVCPIGLTNGVIGAAAPIGITYHLDNCAHEGECRAVCEVPHVLDLTIRGRSEDTTQRVGPDCTRCGLCLDACPTKSLQFKVKGMGDLL